MSLLVGGVPLYLAGPLKAQELLIVEQGRVTVHCPEELDLQILVDYVGKALDVHFLYGEELKGLRVRLQPSPLVLPKDRLLDLLVAMLRVRELAVVEETPGLFRILKSDQTTRSVVDILPAGQAADRDSNRLVTHVLSVPRGKAEAIANRISAFLSSPKSNATPIPETDSIIVSDYESRIGLLQDLLPFLESETQDVQVRTVKVPTADPALLAGQVSSIFAEAEKQKGGSGTALSVRGDVFPGAIVLIGPSLILEEAVEFIESLIPERGNWETKTYAPHYLSLDRAQKLIEKVALAPGSSLPQPLGIYADSVGGRLFVTAEAKTQEAIEKVLKNEDLPPQEAQRPLRVYRPKHRKAAELLSTLTQLLGENAQLSEIEPSIAKSASPVARTTPSASTTPASSVPVNKEDNSPKAGATRSLLRVTGPDYILTEDEHTNAILAIGSREFHAQLNALIDELDQRRPQVLIEMMLVAVTLSDSLDLGVELEQLDLGHPWDHLVFTNFGLSEIDVVTGQRQLIPGIGGNGVLIGPDEVPLILRALATRGSAKVMSTPKILVSDNARGVLRNVDEAPFTSVNASDTVATTSFAGFESAGTTLSVTPHILEGEQLTLEYELSFSNFTGSSGLGGIPPPRTTNSFNSTVEVPDGFTIVTGGLVIDNNSETISELPGVGRIPILGRLFQSSSVKNTKTKVFAFIRPTILREGRLEELKTISLKDAEGMDLNIHNPVPESEPLWMR